MQDKTNSQAKPGYRLAISGTLFAVLVIVLGAFTRLVDAGLGCPDWPGCYGHILWPMDEAEVAAANAAFPEAPVEHDKTWPEQVHRLLAISLGLICIGFVVMAYRQRQKGFTVPLKLTLVLLAMVIVQGMFGRWTVTLNLWPQVVTAHLIGGFTTLSLIWLLTLRLQNCRWQMTPKVFAEIQRLKPLLLIALSLVIVQILLGGWTSTNYAALACPDLPTCQGQWWPNMDFTKGFNFAQDIGPNYLGGLMENSARTAIHFSHRIGAIVVTFVVSYLVYRLLRIKEKSTSQWAIVLAFVLFLQIGLGLSNVYWSLPLPIAVAHNAVAAMLLLTFVGLCHRFYTSRPDQPD